MRFYHLLAEETVDDLHRKITAMDAVINDRASTDGEKANAKSLKKKTDGLVMKLLELEENWSPKPHIEPRAIKLDYDMLIGKAFRITDPEGNPKRSGFSIVTPMNGTAWTTWNDRPEFSKIVRQKLNDPGFLADHKYYQIVQSAKKLRLIK